MNCTARRPTRAKRSRRGIVTLLFSAAMSILAWPATRLPAQAEADTRPTLAIMPFTNGALIAAADYAPLSKGIAELLLTDLSANEKIRLVERDRLEDILTEQRVQTANDVDQTLAVRLGKLLENPELFKRTPAGQK